MNIYTTTVFIILILYVQKLKQFLKLPAYWAILTLIFYLILYNIESKYRLLFIIFVCKTRILFIPIFTMTGVILSIIGHRFKTYRIICTVLYKIGLNLEMNTNNIPTNPTIYMSNYPSNNIEYLTHGLFCDKFCLVVGSGIYKYIKYIYDEKHLISVHKGSFDSVQDQIKKKIADGFSIFCYIEKEYFNRKSDFELTEFRTGMFHIAKNLNVTITPVCVDHIIYNMGIIDDNVFKIKIGQTMHVENVEESMNIVRKFMLKELKNMRIPKIAKHS
jgi:hypothetical protein